MAVSEGTAGLSVFLTGGTGFVGSCIARRLAQSGHRIRALVRKPAEAVALSELGAELVTGDVTSDAGLMDAVAGCDAVIHVVGIIREAPPAITFEKVHTRGTLRVLEAAKSVGVGKFVQMSALGAKPDGTAYQRTKHEAEQLVARSSLPFVIFRPSIIVGEGSEFLETLFHLLRYSPVAPVIGDGRYRLQPVDVEDVASAFVSAVERQDLNGSCLELGGPHKLTYNRILEIICEELGLRRRRLHVPVGLVRPLVDLASNWRLPTPINVEQLAMLLEESVVAGEQSVFRETFGIEPTSLRSVLQRRPRGRVRLKV